MTQGRAALEAAHREAMAGLASQAREYRTEAFGQVTVHEQRLQAELTREATVVAGEIEAERRAVLEDKEAFMAYCTERRVALTEAQSSYEALLIEARRDHSAEEMRARLALHKQAEDERLRGARAEYVFVADDGRRREQEAAM